jgi:hypothetical protein
MNSFTFEFHLLSRQYLVQVFKKFIVCGLDLLCLTSQATQVLQDSDF